MAKIAFQDKQTLIDQPSIAEVNKMTSSNVNEIKASVNELYDSIENSYIDIASSIVKNVPSDMVITRARIKKAGGNTTLDMVLTSSTGFTSGGAASNICTLPSEARPTVEVISICGLSADNSYPTWDGTNSGRAVGYLKIETSGIVYVRYPGTTMKTIQIHITY